MVYSSGLLSSPDSVAKSIEPTTPGQALDDVRTGREPSAPSQSAVSESGLALVWDGHHSDIRKGRAAIRQQVLWEQLITLRIELQKAIQSANTLVTRRDSDRAISTSSESVLSALNDLQEKLLQLGKRIEAPNGHPSKVAEVNTAAPLQDQHIVASHMANQVALRHSEDIHILSQWSSKSGTTQLAVDAGESRYQSSSQTIPTSLVGTLTQNAERYLQRSNATSELHRNGSIASQQDEMSRSSNQTVFDDSDFYHRMLKDLISSRDGIDAAIAPSHRVKAKKYSAQSQPKATKGRKLRFETHDKLRSFMVPMEAKECVSVDGSQSLAWHHGQIDQLFVSLAGDRIHDGMNLPNKAADSDAQGLRIL